MPGGLRSGAFAGDIAGRYRSGLLDFYSAGAAYIYNRGAVTIIDDCYNANPDSVTAAIRCADYPVKSRN